MDAVPFTVFYAPFYVDCANYRKPDARSKAACLLTVVLFLIGISGLFMEDTSLVPLWIIIIGIAGACAFSLSMIFFSLRTKNSQEAAELSGMAQTIGYLLAAIGPLLFGLLHDLTHNWTVPLLLLLVATFSCCWLGSVLAEINTSN